MTIQDFNMLARLETESVIQDLLLGELRKYCAVPIATEVTTRIKYRPDFILTSLSGRKVAIETDGNLHHSPEKDLPRDTALIRSGCIHAIYRISGKDVNRRRGDVLHMLSIREPWMFTPRFHAFAEQLCHPAGLREDTIEPWQGYSGMVREFYDSEYDLEYGEPMPDCDKITIIRYLKAELSV